MRIHYSTADLTPSHKYDYWHEVVCKHFVTANSVKKHDGGFEAELTCNRFGRTQVSRLDAPSHRWKRDRSHIRRDDQDDYLLGVVRQGEGRLEQNGNTAVQRKGGIGLYDTALPFTYDLSASIYILTLPRDIISSRAPHARQLLARNLECDPGLTASLCDMIECLLDLEADMRQMSLVKEHLSNSLMSIVMAILDLNGASQTTDDPASASMEKMLAYARANLTDPDLCPADIASYACVSVRTMNRLFGRQGTTPMRWVLQERVRLGERYLSGKLAKSVTEAAFMAGFNDISHFSRSFKQQFGYSPAQTLKRG